MLFDTKEKFLNWLISHSPFWIQYLFMERVMKSVKASLREEEANKVLFSEEEGSVLARRRNQSSDSLRTFQLDLLAMQAANQPTPSFSELLRSNRRAYRAALARRNTHLG